MTSATEKNRMTLGSSEQTDDAIAELRKTVRDAFSGESVSMLVEGNAIMQAIDKVEIATLGSDASTSRLAEELRGIADEMRHIGASTMTPHELLAFYAREVDKVADSLVFATAPRSGTLIAEQVRETVLKHGNVMGPRFYGDWQAIADELNANLGSGSTKNLMLRVFGLAQMMYDCWLEECKAGDNVDISACNAYSYEFDQIAQAMFDMGIDPNGSDYYRSGELGNVTCELREASWDDGTCTWGVICSACGAKHEHTYGYAWNFCPSCGKRIRKTVEQ